MCKKSHIWQCISGHTIRKCKKMAGQNTFEILLLNDANMIGEHQETSMKMTNMCPFEKRHFLTWIDLNPGFGRNCDTFLKKFTNERLEMKVFGAKLEIANLALLISCMEF